MSTGGIMTLPSMANTVKWLTAALTVFARVFTVVSMVIHFEPSQKAMSRSRSVTPADRDDSS